MISIAMATYNGEAYLQKQIDSIRNQTWQDIELVICDDASTDRTWKILQKNAKIDKRIRCFQNCRNLGFKKNFELAMLRCQGEFIALADQDDIWLPDHIAHLKKIIGNHSIACGDADLIDEKDNPLRLRLSERDHLDLAPQTPGEIAYRVFFNTSCFQGASMLLSRNFLNVALPFPEKVKYHDAWLSALSCFEAGLCYSRKIVTLHRRHAQNTSRALEWHSLKLMNFRRAPSLADRPIWIEEIQRRCTGLNGEQQNFLTCARGFYKRRKQKMGKLLNVFFRLSHYSEIYSTRSRLYLEW